MIAAPLFNVAEHVSHYSMISATGETQGLCNRLLTLRAPIERSQALNGGPGWHCAASYQFAAKEGYKRDHWKKTGRRAAG
jgi:hypothetical protein